MAFARSFLIILCSLTLFFLSPIIAQTSFRPKALVLPVLKDAATLQYVTEIKQRTPLVPVKLTVHLGGEILWVDCDRGYVSSTNKTARCGSAQCSLARAKACGVGTKTCGRGPENPVTNTGTHGDLRIDVVSIQSTNGRNPGRRVSVPNFIFLCGSTFLLEGLAAGVTGIAGLGRSKVALPSQFAAAFSFDRKFAICLSPFSNSNGFIIFGDGPYVLSPDIDVSKSLTYTPLFINPVNTASGFLGEPSVEYFIGVKSITINGRAVPLNTTLLSIDSEGVGGTKISTVNPYTVLETSIYKALVQAFINAMPNVPRVSPIAPFGACFDSKDLPFTRIGPFVPQIDLVLQNKNVKWSIHGQNSMVQVGNVWCLGFVDGGVNPTTSIVIGGRQLENNLLQFDLATSRLGFSNSLLFERTICSNFNFTSTA
ncbi:Basic 7S globulin [Melia azedarach]|uniref:Basic 7S globulin n=1 Tax=Melia azedarach TaxID=155640 RepID=A0ACC1YG81_MELAZ|nr:Basic 7S globulin [Melia azedarach]